MSFEGELSEIYRLNDVRVRSGEKHSGRDNTRSRQLTSAELARQRNGFEALARAREADVARGVDTMTLVQREITLDVVGDLNEATHEVLDGAFKGEKVKLVRGKDKHGYVIVEHLIGRARRTPMPILPKYLREIPKVVPDVSDDSDLFDDI